MYTGAALAVAGGTYLARGSRIFANLAHRKITRSAMEVIREATPEAGSMDQSWERWEKNRNLFEDELKSQKLAESIQAEADHDEAVRLNGFRLVNNTELMSAFAEMGIPYKTALTQTMKAKNKAKKTVFTSALATIALRDSQVSELGQSALALKSDIRATLNTSPPALALLQLTQSGVVTEEERARLMQQMPPSIQVALEQYFASEKVLQGVRASQAYMTNLRDAVLEIRMAVKLKQNTNPALERAKDALRHFNDEMKITNLN
jgi:hypothetical protein